MKIRLTSLGIGACLAILLCYGLLMLATGILDNAEAMARTPLIPYDSAKYAAVGEAGDIELSSGLDIILGALNFSTLSIIYGFFQNQYASGALAFLLLNIALVSIGLSHCMSVLADAGCTISSRRLSLLLPTLVILCMPYVWGWVLVPNKELIVGAAVASIMHLINRKQMAFALVIAILAASVKVQFLYATLLYLFTVWLPYRKTLCLAGIGLVLPVVLMFYDGLTVAQFVENVEGVDVVRTAWFFSILDQIAAYPLGFMVVAPVRLLVNCIGGLNPLRLIDAPTLGDRLAPATSMILGILCLAFLVLRWRVALAALMRRATPAWHFFYSFLVVSCLVPYLQPRYFWWLIPMIVVALVSWIDGQFSHPATRSDADDPQPAQGTVRH